ncbi:hypothetical protein FA95DRAFT_1604979 [Auriscalpium vulgare]|uniref:Uncharacterized protein n=1 Tax=Auriscalpium vulgare TaxID=40419 RepID=A0ACB8RXU0_9AGAM|nr:hypothetical protein FA95DRAFT_1604979 [Auriscalpium vulgare]
MAAKTKVTTLEELTIEFSPPLDTSLLAALLADLDSGPPNESQIEELRSTLALLAAQAEQQAEHDERLLTDAFSEVRIDDSTRSSAVDPDTSNNSEAVSTSYATTASASASPPDGSPRSDASSVASFSSPLGFLQAAFPHIASHRLRAALQDAGYEYGEQEDVDIVGVIEALLTKEYLRDLEERGVDALDDDGELLPRAPPAQWETVEAKKKKKGKGKTIALNDVRQQHHVRPGAARHGSCSPAPPRFGAVDTWTAVSSLSTRLAALLPSHPETFFQSFFHRPDSPTPAAAVRAALSAVAGAEHELSAADLAVLFNMHDILRSAPEYDELDGEERDRFLSDAELALCAAHGRADEALDLVSLLRGLDADEAGEWEMGPYHRKPTKVETKGSLKVTRDLASLPLGLRPESESPPTTPTTRGGKAGKGAPPAPNAWNIVPVKKPAAGANPHAAFIPAYNPMNGVSGKKAAQADIWHAVGTVAVGGREAMKQRRRMEDLQSKRKQAIIQAGRAWQKGNSKNHGGEVALFYAEQARKLQEESRKEALEVARGRVEAQRKTSASGTTVDLHGTTIVEAVTIAKESLEEHGATPAQPLKFITGRGNHSVNNKGVLGPAIKAALVEDGWNVSTFDAGLVVRGRQIGRT